MMRPAEATKLHSRILRVTLEEEQAREYWRRTGDAVDPSARAEAAFNEYWFGPRSMPRVKALLGNFDLRFGTYPHAIEALRVCSPPRATRLLVCHWHLQLADPLYRRFTGEYCVARRDAGRDLTRDIVLRWVCEQDVDERWNATSRAQFASKLLSAAYSAGMVQSNRDPRPVVAPGVPSAALGYLLHLLREIEFAGQINDNPYLASVGLSPSALAAAIRSVPGISIRASSNLVEMQFDHGNLLDWIRDTQREDLLA